MCSTFWCCRSIVTILESVKAFCCFSFSNLKYSNREWLEFLKLHTKHLKHLWLKVLSADSMQEKKETSLKKRSEKSISNCRLCISELECGMQNVQREKGGIFVEASLSALHFFVSSCTAPWKSGNQYFDSHERFIVKFCNWIQFIFHAIIYWRFKNMIAKKNLSLNGLNLARSHHQWTYSSITCDPCDPDKKGAKPQLLMNIFFRLRLFISLKKPQKSVILLTNFPPDRIFSPRNDDPTHAHSLAMYDLC